MDFCFNVCHSLSLNTEYRDLGKYDDDITPYEKGFRFTVSLLTSDSVPVVFNETYFTLTFLQVAYFDDGINPVLPVRTDLQYEIWDLDKEFGHTDKDFSGSGFVHMYWPIKTDYQVAGNVEGNILLVSLALGYIQALIFTIGVIIWPEGKYEYS